MLVLLKMAPPHELCRFILIMPIFLSSFQEAFHVAEEMKMKGNESFKNSNYYDALWKYEHSYLLLDSIMILKVEVDACMAVVHSNVAASCLKLGDDGRLDLLRSVEDFPIHQIMWYGYAHQHAHQALLLEPSAKIAWKVSGVLHVLYCS